MPNEINNTPASIEGVIILKGAAKLEQALRAGLPNDYKFYATNKPLGGFFVTKVSVKIGDHLVWSNKIFQVDYTEQFFDGETLSFTLAMLQKPIQYE
jgi:type IV secretory pathway TrbF-like protein